MSEVSPVTTPPASTPSEDAAVSWFEKNVVSVLHEIVNSIPLRHEWEQSRLHAALDNIKKDPASILAVLDPRAPTQGADNPQIAALTAQVESLSALVEKLVGTTPVETPPVVVETPPVVETTANPDSLAGQ